MAHFAIITPILIYGAFCLASHIDIGLRHLLPIYPFLFILTAVWISKIAGRARIIAIGALTALLIIESLAIYPHYLAFFNWFVGGPSEGPRYLADSNIDWGQDVKKLREYLDRERIQLPCISYFGQADLAYYGIHARELEPGMRPSADCRFIAISASPLVGLYAPGDPFASLRRMEPLARVGYSIYLYDLRGQPPK